VRTRRRHARRPSGERANLTRDLFERVITRRTLPAFAHVDTMGVVEKLSFADLARRAARWSWLLRAHGIANGDRVVVIAGRRPEWLAATLGALNGGAIGVPLPESASAEDVEAIVQHARASLVVAPSALCGEREDLGGAAVLRVEDAQGALADQPTSAPTYDTVGRDIAMLLYERDAEGELRAAAHTHQSLLAQADAGELWLRATPGDRLWSTAEPGSTESVWSALAAWSQATELVVADGDPAPHDAVRLMELLVVQLLWLTPDRYRGLADIEWPRWLDAPRIRVAVSSSPVDDEVVEAFAVAYGARIRSGYLRPETGLLAGEPADGPRRAGSLGVPLPGRELATVDGRGRQPEPGEAGELAVRAGSVGVFAGWWNDRERRAVAPRGGWHRLGEPAVIDVEGFLRSATADEAARVAAERIDAAAEERRAGQARTQAVRGGRAGRGRAQGAEKQRRKEERERAREQEQHRRDAARAEKASLKAAEQERRAEERRQAELRKRDELEQRRQQKARAKAEAARQGEAAAEERRHDELRKREQLERQRVEQEQADAEVARQREAAAAAVALERQQAERVRQETLERELAESQELERRRAEKEGQRRAAEEQRAAEEARRREESRRAEEEAARLLEESKQRDELAKRRREIEAAEHERRRAEAAEAERRAAESARLQEEERRRREIEAAEHERRRAEEAARQRAAAERSEQERRRAAAERAEQERRRAEEAERRRAAAELARKEEEQRRQAQLEQRRKRQDVSGSPERPKPAAAPAETESDAPNPSLIARIAPYTATPDEPVRPRSSEPPEQNGSDEAA
jgi:acyl-coenzyme A synthetase/AMP-(fatty) acid ligase